jgi:hypothetical protein
MREVISMGGVMGKIYRLAHALRAYAFGVFVIGMLAASSQSFAIGTTYTCTDQQRLMIGGASCIAKPYQLVCTDDGLYGCCKSECECTFRGRVSSNKGWGGGARNLTSFSISNTCPVPTTVPRAPVVPGSDVVDSAKTVVPTAPAPASRK